MQYTVCFNAFFVVSSRARRKRRSCLNKRELLTETECTQQKNKDTGKKSRLQEDERECEEKCNYRCDVCVLSYGTVCMYVCMHVCMS